MQILEFSCIQTNTNIFLYFFQLRNFFVFFWNFKEKTGIFNNGLISYSVSLQTQILNKMVGKHVRDP
jgi:hypothetical protein